MKLFSYIPLLTLFTLIAISPSSLFAEEQNVIPEGCKELVYSTNPQYPPYDWGVGNNSFNGAGIELLKMVMPPNLPLKAVVYPWKRSMALAAEGEIDLLVNLRINPDRSKYLNFTTHRAFPNPIVVFVRKDKSFTFDSWDVLKGLRGGISSGDTFGGGFDEYWHKELTIEEAPTMLENYKKLDSGRIDYFVTSRYVGEAQLVANPMKHKIIALNPAVSNMDIHFGFSKRSACEPLIGYVSQKLQELDEQGVLDDLLEKYLKVYQETLIH